MINTNESPLAQVIVVGLLRTLLTTCASNNLYSANSKGVDLNRDWECSIERFALEDQGKLQNLLDERLRKTLEAYVHCQSNKDVLNPSKDGLEKSHALFTELSHLKKELERHRILTSQAISSFLIFILKQFKVNCVWQFSYLIQLITDANGALVFLKFITEKFQFSEIQIPQLTE